MDLPEEIYEEFISLEDTSKHEDNIIESAILVLDPLNPECHMQSLCRTCLAVEKDMHTLIRSKDNEAVASEKSLPQIFSSFTNIQLHADEGLPTQICMQCEELLVKSFEFRNKCLHSDRILKSLLKPMATCIKSEPMEAENCLKPSKFLPQLPVINQPKKMKHEMKMSKKMRNSNKKIKTEVLTVDCSPMIEDVEYLEDFDSDLENTMKDEEISKKEDTHENFSYQKSTMKHEVNFGMETSHEDRTKCQFCSQRFQTKEELKDHKSRVHPNPDQSEELTNKCTKCTKSYTSERDLRIHNALHTSKDGKWTCNECSKTFGQKTLLARHIRRHMENKSHACSVCGKQFAERYALVRHTRVHTGVRPEPRFHCHLCQHKFVDQYKLTQHMSTHTDSKPFICARCGKRFRTELLLKSHSLVHSDHKPYKCQYCDERFRHQSSLSTHHRTHTGERPYVCSVCAKVFIQHCNLTLHMRVHTGEKPYACATCNKSFSSCSTLKSHKLTHTGEKPYSCEQCGKRFSRTGLHAHARTHAHKRAFPCAVCTRRFVSPARLRDHERVHTGEKPFECEECKMKFTARNSLVKHIKTHKAQHAKPKLIPKEPKPVKAKTEKKKRVKVFDNNMKSDEIMFDESKIHILNADQVMHLNEDNMPAIHSIHEHPMEVSGELVLQDDGEVKSELVMVDGTHNQYESGICLTDAVQFINADDINVNYANDMNLVTMNDGDIVSTTNQMIEGTTVKLYQLDQSLVQIHRTGDQVTISKITSKVTANF